MTGIPGWNGRRVTAALKATIARHGDTCWLCQHPGANSLDHVHPRSSHPHLTWVPSNHRPAHLGKAGNDKGCQTEGCDCPGNAGRRHTPWTAPTSRKW